MAWCPNCKEEYEDFVEMCAECKIPLVESLDNIRREHMLLVVETEEEATKAIEFLEYSGIQSATTREATSEHGVPVIVIDVLEEDWEQSMKVMQGYKMVEKKEIDEEDFYFNEYEMVDLEAESKVEEYKSSMVSLLLIGGAITILGLLQWIGVIDFLPGNLKYAFVVLGVIMLVGGLMTKSKITDKSDEVSELKEKVDELSRWYFEKYPVESFSRRHQIDTEELDEGALYFAYMDVLVKECMTNPLTKDEKMINTIADEAYHKIIEYTE